LSLAQVQRSAPSRLKLLVASPFFFLLPGVGCRVHSSLHRIADHWYEVGCATESVIGPLRRPRGVILIHHECLIAGRLHEANGASGSDELLLRGALRVRVDVSNDGLVYVLHKGAVGILIARRLVG